MKYLTESRMTGTAIALAVAGLAGCGDGGNALKDATSSAASAASDAAASATAAVSSAGNAEEMVVAAAGSAELGHCYGVNICKGHNDCKTAASACAGQGECSGQGGFVTAPVKGCGDMGGEIKDEWRGTAAAADLVHCYGVNICKGHNDCKTAASACAGQGECKGQGGFVALTTKSCADTGGKVGA